MRKSCDCSWQYRVTHVLANLGWVDLDFGCSTLCLVLLGLMGNWQIWLNNWVRWFIIIDQIQPNKNIRADAPPCTRVLMLTGGISHRWPPTPKKWLANLASMTFHLLTVLATQTTKTGSVESLNPSFFDIPSCYLAPGSKTKPKVKI